MSRYGGFHRVSILILFHYKKESVSQILQEELKKLLFQEIETSQIYHQMMRMWRILILWIVRMLKSMTTRRKWIKDMKISRNRKLRKREDLRRGYIYFYCISSNQKSKLKIMQLLWSYKNSINKIPEKDSSIVFVSLNFPQL